MNKHRNPENNSKMWEYVEMSGTLFELLKRPDTYFLRHMEYGNIFNIDPKIYAVYQSEVNRQCYRRPHHEASAATHGISRYGFLVKCLKNFCPHCIDVVGPRKTRGVYLPIEHDCPRTRVYDLQGNLIEVL